MCPADILLLSRLSKPEYTNGPSSAPELYGASTGVFLVSAGNFTIKSGVARVAAVLVSLRFCKELPCFVSLALLETITLGVVGLSVLLYSLAKNLYTDRQDL